LMKPIILLSLALLLSISSCSDQNLEKLREIETAAKKACACESVSVKESNVQGKRSIELTISKSTPPDFHRRKTKILKQIAKDVAGFCDADEIKIHFIKNPHQLPDRTLWCECPQEKQPEAGDSIIFQINEGIFCKSSSSRIIQREEGSTVLILSLRDLDQAKMNNDEAISQLTEKLKSSYPDICDSITEVKFEFYTGEEGYRATVIPCGD